jgi:hypothetical protein
METVEDLDDRELRKDLLLNLPFHARSGRILQLSNILSLPDGVCDFRAHPARLPSTVKLLPCKVCTPPPKLQQLSEEVDGDFQSLDLGSCFLKKVISVAFLFSSDNVFKYHGYDRIDCLLSDIYLSLPYDEAFYGHLPCPS